MSSLLIPREVLLPFPGAFLAITFAPQGAGSLITAYGGTIQLTQTAGTIQFTGGSLIAAQTNGSWQPLAGGGAGSAPADYGGVASSGFVTANVALRSILLDVTSPPITVTSGQFDPSSLTFLFPASATSAIDYRVTGAGHLRFQSCDRQWYQQRRRFRHYNDGRQCPDTQYSSERSIYLHPGFARRHHCECSGANCCHQQ